MRPVIETDEFHPCFMAAHIAVCELNLAALRMERALRDGYQVDPHSATKLIMIQMFCEKANHRLDDVARRLDVTRPE